MIELDFFLRYSNITMLGVIGFISLRDARQNLSMRLLAALCFSLIALLIALSPANYNFPQSVSNIAAFINVPNTVLLWAFIESLLDDDYKLTVPRWTIIVSFCLLSIPLRMIDLGWLSLDRNPLSIIINIFALTLFAHLIVITLKGRATDLLSARRKFRLIFLVGVSSIGIFSVLSEFLFTGTSLSSLPFAKSAIVFPAILASTLWLLKSNTQNIFIPTAPLQKDKPLLTHREQELYGRLKKLMVEDKKFLEPGLSVGDLAKALAVSDHKVRTLINKKLGFRNFNAFINTYRVEAIKLALVDPEQAHLPILTIALNMGFNSLPPFNRAFKQIEGTTPTAFRQAQE